MSAIFKKELRSYIRRGSAFFFLAASLYLLEQLETVAVGQHYVEHYTVVAVACNLVAGIEVCGRGFYYVALALQCALHYLAQRSVVFNYKQFHFLVCLMVFSRCQLAALLLQKYRE